MCKNRSTAMVIVSNFFNHTLYQFKQELIQLPKKFFCRYFHNKHFEWDNNFNIQCVKCKFVFKP